MLPVWSSMESHCADTGGRRIFRHGVGAVAPIAPPSPLPGLDAWRNSRRDDCERKVALDRPVSARTADDSSDPGHGNPKGAVDAVDRRGGGRRLSRQTRRVDLKGHVMKQSLHVAAGRIDIPLAINIQRSTIVRHGASNDDRPRQRSGGGRQIDVDHALVAKPNRFARG